MITKGIIEKVLDRYSVKVRMPVYNKMPYDHSATKLEDLYTARFCVPPNVMPNPKVGDIVYVGFEDNDQSKLIVLGYLCRTEGQKSTPSITVDELLVNNATYLSSDTSIGKVSPEEISYLIGARNSIQGQIDRLGGRISSINTSIIDSSIKTLTFECQNIQYSDCTVYRTSNVVVVNFKFQLTTYYDGIVILSKLPISAGKVWATLSALKDDTSPLTESGCMVSINANSGSVQLFNGLANSTYIGQLTYLTNSEVLE